MALRRMDSKYDGKCAKCGGWFPAGTRIDFNTDTRKAEHADGVCPDRPAAPPPIALVEVAPLIKQIDAQIEPMEKAYEAARKHAQEVSKAWLDAFTAAGYCQSCQGRGYIQHYSQSWPCGCREKTSKGTDHGSVLRDNPALEPLDRAKNAAAAEVTRLGNGLTQLRQRRDHLIDPAKGYEVVVVKGRKVPKDTRGIVIYLDSGEYGMRLGLKDAQGQAHWTSPSNVVATAIPEKRARQIMDGQLDHTPTRFTEAAEEQRSRSGRRRYWR